MNKPLTVKDLLKLCQMEISKGKGDNVIMLSDDDEGNGYHYCWYSFTNPMCGEEIEEEFYSEFIDERIAPKNKTLILG